MCAESETIAAVSDKEGHKEYENKLINNCFKNLYKNLYSSKQAPEGEQLMDNFFSQFDLLSLSEEQKWPDSCRSLENLLPILVKEDQRGRNSASNVRRLLNASLAFKQNLLMVWCFLSMQKRYSTKLNGLSYCRHWVNLVWERTGGWVKIIYTRPQAAVSGLNTSVHIEGWCRAALYRPSYSFWP